MKGRGIRMRKIRKGVCIIVLWGMIFTGCASSGGGKSVPSNAMGILWGKDYEKSYWPENEMASLIPEPEFDLGRVEWESEYGFAVSVAEIHEGEFNKYAAACYQKGFNINYQKGSAFFCADNKEGYHLILKTRENDIMYVRMDSPWRCGNDWNVREIHN